MADIAKFVEEIKGLTVMEQFLINYEGCLLLVSHDRYFMDKTVDSLFECDQDERIIQQAISLIKEKMENAVKLKVPLRVSIEYGKNWGEFH